MNEAPSINYDEVQPDFLQYNDIQMILKSTNANLSNYRKLFLSKGILNFSDNKENFAREVSTINFGLDSASNFINEIYSKGKFELGLFSIILKKTIDVNEFHQLLSEKAQNVIDFNRSSKLRPVHIENDKYVHIKIVYPNLFLGGKRYLNVNLTSYGIAILEELDNNYTRIEVYSIIKHNRDYTVMRDGMRTIIYEYFKPADIDFKEFYIPIDNSQPKILELTFNKIDNSYDGLYLTDGKLIRLGEMDSTKPIIFRSQQTEYSRFELEEPQEIIDVAKKENWAFKTISFTALDNSYIQLIMEISYFFRKNKTLVKFEKARIYNDDINDNIYNPETGNRSYDKLDRLNEEFLNYGDKFSILIKIINILKNSIK